MKINKLYLGVSVLIIGSILVTHVSANSDREDDDRGEISAKVGLKLSGEGMTGYRDGGVFGTVTAVNGTTITVLDKRSNTSFAVDASAAKIDKNRVTTTVSAIAVGDMVLVEGKTTGTAVVATSIHDGVMVKGNDNWKDDKDREDKNNQMMFPEGNGQPIVGGTVTAVSGSMITITNKSNVSYTVDVINAKIMKSGKVATKTDIMVGDTILAQGTINGTSVTAVSVIDQGTISTDISHENNGRKVGFFRRIGNFFSRLFGSR